MQKTDKLVHQAKHALLPWEVGRQHVKVTKERFLERGGVLRPENVGREQLHDAQAYGEERHMIPWSEKWKVELSPTFQRRRNQR